MQRRIVWLIVGLVLLFGGGAFGLYAYKSSRPYPVWVPIPLNDVLQESEHKNFAAKIEAELRKPSALSAVVKDANLVSRFKVSSEEAAAAELNRRLFVRLSAGTNGMGTPSRILEVGVDGKQREKALLQDTTESLLKQIRRVLVIEDKSRSAF